jgi:calnexin
LISLYLILVVQALCSTSVFRDSVEDIEVISPTYGTKIVRAPQERSILLEIGACRICAPIKASPCAGVMKSSWRLLTLLLLGLVVLSTVARALDAGGMMQAMGEDDDDDDADVGGGLGGPGSAEDSKPDEQVVLNPKGQEKASGYVTPDALEALFIEDFQDGLDKWTYSGVPQYSGRFEIGQGAKPAFPGDRGLIVPVKARHYAMTAPVNVEASPDDNFVVQYEVRVDEGMTCGGAYLKFPTDGETGFKDGVSFDNDVVYSLMFGPDRCGSTDKVHFIFQSRNPSTGKFTEHHLKNPPSVAGSYDKKTHLYSAVVKSDGAVKILVDSDVKRTASLSADFEPPVQPPKQIDDKDDKEPSDWVHEKKIPDPAAIKPEDWDEDAPEMVPDESATMPEGWLVDEHKKIPDPKATKPEEWDDEDDGKWEAPMVDNPKCEFGCGEWVRPTISNPAYKGRWTAPLIDNPKYIGEWSPRKIENPDYYEVGKISLLPIRAVGFEIWTMDQGIVFDNIYIGKDVAAAKKFADATFGKKKAVEDEAEKEARKDNKFDSTKDSSAATSTEKAIQRLESFLSKIEAGLLPLEQVLVKIGAEPMLDKLIDIGINKPLLTVVTIPIVIVSFMLLLMSGGGSKKETREADKKVADKKKTDAASADDDTDAAEDKVQVATGDAREDEPTVRRRRATAE